MHISSTDLFEQISSLQVAVSSIPLTYGALVIENTNTCNAKCLMCYQSAGPKGSDVLGKSKLSTSQVEKILEEAIQIPSLSKRFHLSGGESFLKIDECLLLFNKAKEIGYQDITTTTNGYWARNVDRAFDITKKMREAGVTSIEISWDVWHLPYVSPESVSNCLDACYEYEIDINLRLLATKKHSHQEALSYLRTNSIKKADRITCGPVFPTGRASFEMDINDFFEGGGIEGNCHSSLNLTVNAFGNVFPCCAGIDQTNNYLFGNALDESIYDIANRMNNSPLLRAIVFYGIKVVIPILEHQGYKLDGDYKNICQLCWSVFSNKEHVQAIKDYYNELERNSLERAIQYLMNTQQSEN